MNVGDRVLYENYEFDEIREGKITGIHKPDVSLSTEVEIRDHQGGWQIYVQPEDIVETLPPRGDV